MSVHPGVISTGLLHAMFGAGGAPVERAAAVLDDLAQRPLTTGGYYDEHELATPNAGGARSVGPGSPRRVRARGDHGPGVGPRVNGNGAVREDPIAA